MIVRRFKTYIMTLVCLFCLTGLVFAGPPADVSDNTRYMALGDSLAAGYGAVPATHGYVYLLYEQGVFDQVPNTLFSNSAVPGSTSTDILQYQVPQIPRFHPDVITLSVGGNDLLSLFGGADPGSVLVGFQMNLTDILSTACSYDQNPTVIVGNQYTIPGLIDAIPGGPFILDQFNMIVEGVVTAHAASGCDARIADVYNAFLGKKGLLMIERHAASPTEVHPTNAGYRAMARAFREAYEED